MQKIAGRNPRWAGQRLKTIQSQVTGIFLKTGKDKVCERGRGVRLRLSYALPYKQGKIKSAKGGVGGGGSVLTPICCA